MNLRNHHGQMSESLLTASFIILSGGLQDAYTYLCRGKVFANAQTGNIVLCSAYLFDGQWRHSARYLIPVLSFLLGIFAAECIHRHFKYTEKVHWRQMIILAEIALLFAVGFLPQEKEKKRNRHHSGILKAVFLEPGADGVYPGMPGGTHDNGRHKTDHRTGNGDREDETAEKNDPKRLQEGRIAYG